MAYGYMFFDSLEVVNILKAFGSNKLSFRH